jgi:hypothetical protein
MRKSFKTYSEEKSKDDQSTYDSIISKSEFNQYLTSVKCKYLRVRYRSNDDDWMEIQMLD